MRRLSSVLLQAVESASIALATLLLVGIPAFVALAVGGLAGDPAVSWRVAVDTWMVGHGADVGIALGDTAAAAVGTDAAGAPFVLGIAAWGIGLVTLLLAVRSGMRLARTPEPLWGLAGGTIATSAVGLVLGLSAQHGSAAPNLVHAAVAPGAVMLVGLVIGALWHADDLVGDIASWLALERQAVAVVRAAVRAGLAVAAAFVGLGAVLLAVTLIARQADVISLFEALQPDHLGVVVLWLVQLAMLPTAVVWATSWMLGPGFALGDGSSVSPLGTDLGPVPTLPLLGAIVPGVQPWSLVIAVVPLVAAIAIGALVRQRSMLARAWQSIVVAVAGGIVAGLVLAGLSALASGSLGPGRLATAGPTWWLVGAVGAGIAAVGLAVGMLAGRAPADDEDDDEDDDGEDGDAVDDEAEVDVAALAAAARARGTGVVERLDGVDAPAGSSRPDEQDTEPVAPLAVHEAQDADLQQARPAPSPDARQTAPVVPLVHDDAVDDGAADRR